MNEKITIKLEPYNADGPDGPVTIGHQVVIEHPIIEGTVIAQKLEWFFKQDFASIVKAKQVLQNVEAKQAELRTFLEELTKAKEDAKEKGGLQISEMAGLFERAELIILDEVSKT